ncbi:hypothetical protein [Planococcus dechangensis]|uniref:Lipoprotein n=1 Tax=Planococcus dechangensis TaxID=1176255 RepID=A0ABV9MEB6_9BACL
MNKAKQIGIALWLVGLLLSSGCSSQPVFPPYDGEVLKIAVLGTTPDVREDHIDLLEISFDEFSPDKLAQFDAVFIMRDKLSEAAESQYASVYPESHVPFFFMESNTDAYPFTDPELDYDDAREIPYHNYYATSFLETPDGEQRFSRYSLHNDEMTEQNVKALYSDIFGIIESGM